jgi:hypothetical protein
MSSPVKPGVTGTGIIALNGGGLLGNHKNCQDIPFSFGIMTLYSLIL